MTLCAACHTDSPADATNCRACGAELERDTSADRFEDRAAEAAAQSEDQAAPEDTAPQHHETEGEQ